jgi:hypothetical protein
MKEMNKGVLLLKLVFTLTSSRNWFDSMARKGETRNAYGFWLRSQKDGDRLELLLLLNWILKKQAGEDLDWIRLAQGRKSDGLLWTR